MRSRDVRQRFLIESCDVRGQTVHLDETWMAATARTEYPAPIRQVLGEAFAAAVLLASTIKFDGKMTLQIRGDGPVHLLVVQVTQDAAMRGLARWQDGREADLGEGSLQQLFGDDARMIITIESSESGEPYQGIVPLSGGHLAEALQVYFRTSEQLTTELHLAVSEHTAAGVLLQRLPPVERTAFDRDGWTRATTLAATVTPQELCERDAAGLLNALFHEETVRLFEPDSTRFECSCSRARTNSMLQGLGQAEVQDIIDERGSVEITCEFCDAGYHYDVIDIEALFRGIDAADDPQATRH